MTIQVLTMCFLLIDGSQRRRSHITTAFYMHAVCCCVQRPSVHRCLSHRWLCRNEIWEMQSATYSTEKGCNIVMGLVSKGPHGIPSGCTSDNDHILFNSLLAAKLEAHDTMMANSWFTVLIDLKQSVAIARVCFHVESVLSLTYWNQMNVSAGGELPRQNQYKTKHSTINHLMHFLNTCTAVTLFWEAIPCSDLLPVQIHFRLF